MRKRKISFNFVEKSGHGMVTVPLFHLIRKNILSFSSRFIINRGTQSVTVAVKKVMQKSQQAMTLMEILIAMVIFGLLASMGYGGLSNVIDLQKQQNRIQNDQEDLQRVLLIMARDFYQIVPRPIRGNSGAFVASVSFDANSNAIEFTRSGNSHPITFNRSQFLRVGYRLEDDTLYRLHWHHLDRVLSAVEQKNPLLRQVQSIQYRFMNEKRSWSKRWSPKNINRIPAAIAMILTMDNNVQYVHTFPLVQP